MVYLILGVCSIAAYMLFYTALKAVLTNKNTISIRLEKISKENIREENEELNKPLFVRIIQPILDDISRFIIKVTPKEIILSFEKKVIMAGNPFNLSVKDWISLQVAFIMALPLIVITIGIANGVEARKIFFICLACAVIGLVLPNLILNKFSLDRQKKIINSLPDVLDLLTVSVEAGLGFDGALTKVIDKMPGPLSAEFENVIQEMKVGKHKRDALKDMAERVNVHDLTTFIGSIIQADQLGVSIGNVLRIQSEQMRQKRRQRAQEKAMKAPVKMLIPMILFVFPTIFSVLIGPIAIRVVRTLMK